MKILAQQVLKTHAGSYTRAITVLHEGFMPPRPQFIKGWLMLSHRYIVIQWMLTKQIALSIR